MKFGLSFLPDSTLTTKIPYAYFKDAFELCRIADAENFSYVKMTEHYLHPYGGYCPSPLNFLTAVAVQTKTIRLMTGCILPVFHHPIQIAAESAMVDVISNGRLEVGFARAYLPYEFDAFQIDMNESRERYEETIQAVIQLWTKPQVSIQNRFFAFNKITSVPSPLQKPHPPIWGAAVNSRQTFAWLGEQGFNLLISPPLGYLETLQERIDVYRESFEQAHPTKTPHIALSLPLFMDHNDVDAEALADRYLRHYLTIWADAADAWSGRASYDYPKYTGLGHLLRKNTPQTMMEQKQAIVGSPAKVLDELLRIKETLTIDTVLWQLDCGAQPREISENTLRLFVEKVMPFMQGIKKLCNSEA